MRPKAAAGVEPPADVQRVREPGQEIRFCRTGMACGRAMSRTAARKGKSSGDVYAEMDRLGVVLLSSEPETVAEEAAYAYKDIDADGRVGIPGPADKAADAAGRRQGIVTLTVGLRPAVSTFTAVPGGSRSARRHPDWHIGC
jgi:hypothetical protein